MYSLSHNLGESGTPYRDAFNNTLAELMDASDKIVVLDADLGGASGTLKLQKTHPDQYIEVGISEQNMMGMAAGMSQEGFVPFCHTFAPFATRRCFDQVFLSGGYAHNTINIWGSDPGFTVAANGGTHTSWEDVALMRMIPHSVICDAADPVQLAWIVREFAKTPGVHYVRSGRKASFKIYEEGSSFEMGRGNVLAAGSDVLIISAGQLLKDAFCARDMLAKKGVSAEIIDMFCIKPLDKELVLKEVAGKRALVSFENHSIYGGLGSAIAETLAEAGVAIPFARIGVDEEFGQVGTADWLQQAFGLTASDVVNKVEELLKR